MCTVSFLPQAHGFILTMNRDEQKTRALALPPQQKRNGNHASLYPAEPNGGTWTGVNDAGLAFALVNWNEKRQAAGMTSRGTIIPRLLACDDLDEAGRMLAGLALARINPFRLIGVQGNALRQWRWDGAALDREEKGWRRQSWFSSALDEPGVNRVRSAAVAAMPPPMGLADLRALHRSHVPAEDAYAVCMHRADAQTVSYTEIVVEGGKAVMRYAAGAPCGAKLGNALELKLA